MLDNDLHLIKTDREKEKWHCIVVNSPQICPQKGATQVASIKDLQAVYIEALGQGISMNHWVTGKKRLCGCSIRVRTERKNGRVSDGPKNGRIPKLKTITTGNVPLIGAGSTQPSSLVSRKGRSNSAGQAWVLHTQS